MAGATSKPRTNLTLPSALQERVREMAEAEETTVAELLRTAVKLGLMVLKLARNPDVKLIIRENGVDEVLKIP